jgi:OmcA/MtrC family decaheme c-type cytochrome
LATGKDLAQALNCRSLHFWKGGENIRTSSNERLGDPKRNESMERDVHVHAGNKLHNPCIVTGFQGSVNDYSDVQFPGTLNNCLTCHTEAYGKGTFELPLARFTRSSSVATGSMPGVSVEVNPANDLKTTPTTAVCSSCHDSSGALSHMASTRSGGSFQALQSAIDQGAIRERCVSCHGPGRDKDVRKVHEIEETRNDD